MIKASKKGVRKMKLKVNMQQLKSAMLCKAKNDVRWFLNGVMFAKDGTLVGTNGHVMFVGQHESEIESDLIVDFVCSIPRNFQYAEIEFNSDEKQGVIKFYGQLESNVIGCGMAQIIDGKYPDYTKLTQKVISPCTEIGFNGKYLKLLSDISTLFNPRFSTVKLSLNGDSGCAFAEIPNPEQEKAMLVIMPCRI